MDDKTALNVLLKLLDRYSLNAEEREAVRTAVGVLSWSSVAKNSIKRRAVAYNAKRYTAS
jgi:hypothetical protein